MIDSFNAIILARRARQCQRAHDAASFGREKGSRSFTIRLDHFRVAGDPLPLMLVVSNMRPNGAPFSVA
ncbi:hypothetical protein C0V97_07915 [Asaia sp. W19]|nr:hypothetical protein C0V97_07915 [Asaia sp. W19]